MLERHGLEGYLPPFLSPLLSLLQEFVVLEGDDLLLDVERLLCFGFELGIYLIDAVVLAVVANPLKLAFLSPPLAQMLGTGRHIAKTTK